MVGRQVEDRSFSRHRNEGGSDIPGVTHVASRPPACQPTSGQPRPLQTYPLVRDLAAEGFSVRLACGVLGFSTQAFYAWCKDPVPARDLDDAYAINALIDAHADDPAFGYRFLADELERAGIDIGERRAWRLCSQQKLWSTTVRKGRKGKRPGPAVNDDHVQRNFTAAEPNRTWVTDITEHPTTWIPAVVATPRTMRGQVKQPAVRRGCPSRVPSSADR